MNRPATIISVRDARWSALAWWVGLLGAALTVAAAGIQGYLGLFSAGSGQYVALVLASLAGAAIAAKHPRNAVGWLMIATNLVVGVFVVFFEYGYLGTRGGHSGLPLAVWALWIASWLWVPAFGLTVPTGLVRFPDDRVKAGWWFVDWLAIGGATGLALALAVRPGPMYPRGFADNPIGIAGAHTATSIVYNVSLGIIALAMGLSVASLVVRLRDAQDDEAQQLKWIAFAAAIVAVSLIGGIVAVALLHLDFNKALDPFTIAVLALPVSIGVAILRYGLYEIDLIINRTLVYAGLTAILGGLYTALVTLTQRVFIATTGQRSDAAVVLTAFVVAGLFTPIRDWLQKLVNRHVSPRNPNESLDQLSQSLDAIVGVFDGDRIARKLLSDAVASYDAKFGVLYLIVEGSDRVVHREGPAGGVPSLEIPIRFNGRDLGRLQLGQRRGAATYTKHHLETLQRSADAVARALVLADRFGGAPEVR
jgi:hypothetical protein